MNLNSNLNSNEPLQTDIVNMDVPYDYDLQFDMPSAILNQMDLHPGKWKVLPGTSRLVVTTRVLAGWLLHIALHPHDVLANDSELVFSLVYALYVEDIISIAHIVRTVTRDWRDDTPCHCVLQYLEEIAGHST